MKYQIEVPVPQCHSYTYRSTDINNAVNEHLKEGSELSLEEMQELLEEVKIRFDTNPNFYLKNDYRALIEFISQLFNKHKSSNFGGPAVITTIPDSSKLYIAIEPGIYNNFLNSEQNPVEVTEDDFNEKIVIFNPKLSDPIYYEKVIIDISKSISTKADKVKDAVDGNLPSLNAEGNLVDSGKKVGSSTLEENPNENTLATEQAVDHAIENARIHIKEGDPLLNIDDQKLLFSTLKINHDPGKKEIQLLGKNDILFSSIPTTDFIKDGILENAELGFYTKIGDDYIPSTEPEALPYVVLTFNADAGKIPIYLSFNDLVVYTKEVLKDDLHNKMDKCFSASVDTVPKFNGNGQLVHTKQKLGGEQFFQTLDKVVWKKNNEIIGYTSVENLMFVFADKNCTIIKGQIHPVLDPPWDMYLLNEEGNIDSGFQESTVTINEGDFEWIYKVGMPNYLATESGVVQYVQDQLKSKLNKVVSDSPTLNRISTLTEEGDLQNSEVTIGQEEFKESSIVTITCQGQRYYVDVPKELIYTDLIANTPIYSDVFFRNEVGHINGQGGSGAVDVTINNNSTRATIGEYTGFMPNVVATELGVENYITSYISTQKDIENILKIIP